MKMKFWRGAMAGLTILLAYQFSLAEIYRLEFFPSQSPLDDFGGKRVIPHPKIGLALSGGGARGLSQIGVLKVLERENIQLAGIAGTSIGGIIGGLFSAGYSAAQLESLAYSIDWRDLLSDSPARLSLLQPQREEAEGALFQIRWDGLKPQIPSGLTSAQKLTNLFSELTSQADYFSGSDFDRLEIPFRCVTTDLITGTKIVFDSGGLALALRATMAVPLAVTPLSFNGMLLVDGGLVDPIPVGVAKEMGIDIVIAVNTSASLLPEEKIKDPFDIAAQATSILSLHKREESLKAANLVIAPELSNYSSTDFDSVAALIKRGEEAAGALLPQMKELLKPGPDTQNFNVREVHFDGNDVIVRESLLVWSNLTTPGFVTKTQIYNALSRIYQSGYFQEVYAELDSSAGRAKLVFHLRENPLVGKIHFQGDITDTSQYSWNWGNPHPQILNRHQFQKVFDDRLSQIRQAGASLAELKSLEYHAEDSFLVAALDLGLISEINIEGNQVTRDWVIRSNFSLEKGDYFNLQSAQRGLNRLQSSGFFEQVTLSLSKTSAGAVVNLSLKEKKYLVLTGGAHYWDEYHLEGFLQAGHANILGSGNQFQVRASYGDRRESYQAGLKANRIFMTYLTYDLTLYYQAEENFLYSSHVKVGDFKVIRRGGRLSLGHSLARLGKASLDLILERISVDNSVVALTKSDDKRGLQFKILFDNLDRYPYPQSGNYNQIGMEIASQSLGGNLAYRKFHFSLETYLPFTTELNLHPGFRFGYSDRGLPLYEKFYLSGPENFYGFHSQEERGDRVWQGSLELRLRTAKRIHWFIRYDIGELWNKDAIIQELKHGLGLKLGITTPLGPIELAYGVNSNGIDEFYFTFGYPFK